MKIEKPLLQAFLQKHALPESYQQVADKYFFPLAQRIYDQALASTQPIVVGINGCQGSGKSTLTDLLVDVLSQQFQCPAIGLSIDDFYLSKQERLNLSQKVHPLFKTRGVPGTHNVGLMLDTLQRLKNGLLPTPIPSFNKAIDDPLPESQWPVEEQRVQVVLFEGWCVGAGPQSESELVTPVNDLEKTEDADAAWRSYSNKVLAEDYQAVFSLLDRIVMLKAPGFHTVKGWRSEQEQKLRTRVMAQGGSMEGVMTDAEVERFIQHYERITVSCFSVLPEKTDDLFLLNDQRQVQQVITNEVAR
ncbi:kinase [Reinekea marinisedimentorum]|uniref:D-glycerate 3-kinase n=1 Tax=Reinekea marinisedimentorum TaxID=230495 RepID=A0A4R3I2H9_9GAMM|nr:kinase [Reinekea marinisedimentorum]TCS39996.1 D-glycerate 3-kinase [Reinekea marinisedimentorum]